MSKRINYSPEFRDKIARLHLQEGRTLKSLKDEYGVAPASVSRWCSDIREECLDDDSSGSGRSPKDYEKENRQLRRELAEKEKEISFLKKAAAFFAKELA